jgi:ATP-dependent Clp protease ATP-binding subunit ClpX
MYDLPSRRDVKSFTITRELVEQRSKAKVLAMPSGERGEQASA